jgi:hypothetical protein
MTLPEYALTLVQKAGKSLRSGEIFAKVLTPNDDSGRHGVLVPSDVYSFFPELEIPDLTKNTTGRFDAFDVMSGKGVSLAYKYYERYPERRITRVNTLINDRLNEPRIAVFLRAYHVDGTTGYYFDCANSGSGGRFAFLFGTIFGAHVAPAAGVFILRPVEATEFAIDANLTELLNEFDRVRDDGWVNSLREGDTGIGYTFETLLGIEENNEKVADFKGIEIKCKSLKEGALAAGGKINLFQHGPEWIEKLSSKQRIRQIGKEGADGLYSCHSQVTTNVNNLGLSLMISSAAQKIDLRKSADGIGYWTFESLGRRLAEKHSRAVFIKASIRKKESKSQFRYDELVYCERPSIDRFMNLVGSRNIVFEFLMSEKSNGTVRNHGYPWRLTREEFLDQLFSFQIKLR